MCALPTIILLPPKTNNAKLVIYMKSVILCLSVALPLQLAAATTDYPHWVLDTPLNKAAYCQEIIDSKASARYLAYARASMILPNRSVKVRYGSEVLAVNNSTTTYSLDIQGATNGIISSPSEYSVDEDFYNAHEVCVLVSS